MSEETQKEEGVSVVGAPTLTPQPQTEADLDDIVGEIGEEIEADEAEETDAPTSETPVPAIDISKLTIEQLQELQARLNATPSAAETQKHKTYVKLREYQGKIVVDFSNAFIGLMDDPENNRQVHRHFIKIKLKGEDQERTIPYQTFMQLEQIDCEVIKEYSSEDPIKAGTTYDEHGQLVQMTVVRKEYEYKIVTPSGEEMMINGKIANG